MTQPLCSVPTRWTSGEDERRACSTATRALFLAQLTSDLTAPRFYTFPFVTDGTNKFATTDCFQEMREGCSAGGAGLGWGLGLRLRTKLRRLRRVSEAGSIFFQEPMK